MSHTRVSVSCVALCALSLLCSTLLAQAQDAPSPAASAPTPAASPSTCGDCEFAAVDGVLGRLPTATTECGAECVELDVSDLGATGFAAGVFEGLNLTSLKLDDNALSDWADIKTALAELAGLVELSLSNNEIAALPADAFEFPTTSAFNASALASLVLSSNELTELLPDSLAPLTGLEMLSLNGNPIGPSMNSSTFTKNEALDDLRLDNMNLSSVPLDLFKGNAQLTQIELDANSLTELPDDLFSGVKLEKLQLGGNDLTALPSSISTLVMLKVLAAEDNLLVSIKDAFFANMTELNTLELQNQAPGFCVPPAALPTGFDAASTGAPLCDADGKPLEATTEDLAPSP